MRRDVSTILDSFVAADRPIVGGKTVVVLAHPDDETLGCGALLPRIAHLTLVHVTDGAPRSLDDARRQGYATATDYAAARQRELAAALAAGGVSGATQVTLGIPDQEATFHLPQIVRHLVPILSGSDIVLTHAYEGGHPDHDATACAVHAACGVIGPGAPVLVEMPFYRAGPADGEWLRQSFADGPVAVLLRLTPEERRRKLAMLTAHASQAKTLDSFGAADEAYRLAPATDFAKAPNGGRILYDSFGWAVRWPEFQTAARTAFMHPAPGSSACV